MPGAEQIDAQKCSYDAKEHCCLQMLKDVSFCKLSYW